MCRFKGREFGAYHVDLLHMRFTDKINNYSGSICLCKNHLESFGHGETSAMSISPITRKEYESIPIVFMKESHHPYFLTPAGDKFSIQDMKKFFESGRNSYYFYEGEVDLDELKHIYESDEVKIYLLLTE